MHADHFYTIGAGHEVCQDYTASGPDFAVLSDGCSSAAHSDWGARMLVQLTSLHLASRPFYPLNIRELLRDANEARFMLGLPFRCLSATLAYVAGYSTVFTATIVGDGYIAARRRDDHTIEKFIKIEYTSGAPHYPAYDINANDREAYHKEFGDGKLRIIGDGAPIEHPLDPKLGSPYLSWNFDRNEYDLVAVFSDGLGQFASPRGEHLDLAALCDFMHFKSLAGRFVQRRCRKVFEEFKKQGIVCRDDFSMIAVYDPDPSK
jgi:hypothetical protein